LGGNLDPLERSLLQFAMASAAAGLRKLRARKRHRDWIATHPNKPRLYNRRWYRSNHSEIAKRRRQPDNLSKKSKFSKQYQKTEAYKNGRRDLYKRHGDKIRAKSRAFSKSARGRKYQSEYKRIRRRNIPGVRFAEWSRTFVNRALWKARTSKKFKRSEMFGCDLDSLKLHIESLFEPWMNWSNRGTWDVDHIIPVKAFDLSDPEHQRWCFYFKNLRPLRKCDNQSKGGLIPNPLPSWLPSHIAERITLRSKQQVCPPS